MDILREAPLRGFLLAAAAGVLLGAVYDVLRIARTLMHISRTAVFIGDIGIMLAACVVTFLIALASNNGILRFYVLAGEGIGACLYFLTLGELTLPLARILRRAGLRIRKKVLNIFEKRLKNRGQV